jgi:hypothetical protein
MIDIVAEAIKQHMQLTAGRETNWNIAFMNGHMIRGQIKEHGDGKYAVSSPHGSVYFCFDKVIYLYPVK